MIQWVYERASRSRLAAETWVATDDVRIEQVIRGLGGRCLMTPVEGIRSGTDRVACLADQVAGDVFVNVQGDEPAIEPETIDAAIELVTSNRFEMATAMTRFETVSEVRSPAAVKVIADHAGRAIYFSRLPIPYGRLDLPDDSAQLRCFRHLGLYTYRRETLFRIRDLPPSRLEEAEMLEQLRALEAGISIGVAEVQSRSFGIDTPDDLERARRMAI